MTANEDFLFAQEAQALGFVTDAQVKEAFALQRRMSEDLRLDERLGVILVKRGYMAEDQARRVYARIEPKGAAPGQIVGYRLIDVVGRGAMGTVYRALHLGLNREVALKILRDYFVSEHTLINRFQAEARVASALNHPNILTIYDAGQFEDISYIAAEYIDGPTIRQRIGSGNMSLGEVLAITSQLLNGLSAAHMAGIIHRDIKPENLMQRSDSVVKILDFGIAKLLEPSPSSASVSVIATQTSTGMMLGTIGYMSPEQVRGLPVDERSDIWSCGVVFYEMLAGERPFASTTPADTMVAILEREPQRLTFPTGVAGRRSPPRSATLRAM